ncbi:protein takeout-like [Schistocerca piceifrons]|uniref:protein takeout-like n=1 Tax=Schistocerca piceifrons TaxID=274613 RepID=UPI001F5F9FC7|nr:protein takeout-like [Schistocerca piceifrons]
MAPPPASSSSLPLSLPLLVLALATAATLCAAVVDIVEHTPEYIRPCPRKDPNANGCIRELFQHMFPYLAKGIPEIGVAPYEPLRIPRLALSKGQGAVLISGSFSDIVVRGPSNATTTFGRLDTEQQRLEFGLQIPDLRLEGNYDLKGHILLLPLVGNGRATLRLGNTTTTVSTRYVVESVRGRDVVRIVTMKVDFTVASMHIHLYNLFNGNKVLGHTLNTFLNKNGQEVLADLEEPLGEALSEVFIVLVNQIFTHIPLDIWLPSGGRR